MPNNIQEEKKSLLQMKEAAIAIHHTTTAIAMIIIIANNAKTLSPLVGRSTNIYYVINPISRSCLHILPPERGHGKIMMVQMKDLAMNTAIMIIMVAMTRERKWMLLPWFANEMA